MYKMVWVVAYLKNGKINGHDVLAIIDTDDVVAAFHIAKHFNAVVAAAEQTVDVNNRKHTKLIKDYDGKPVLIFDGVDIIHHEPEQLEI